MRFVRGTWFQEACVCLTILSTEVEGLCVLPMTIEKFCCIFLRFGSLSSTLVCFVERRVQMGALRKPSRSENSETRRHPSGAVVEVDRRTFGLDALSGRVQPFLPKRRMQPSV